MRFFFGLREFIEMNPYAHDLVNSEKGDRRKKKVQFSILCSHFYNICHIIIEFRGSISGYWIESNGIESLFFQSLSHFSVSRLSFVFGLPPNTFHYISVFIVAGELPLPQTKFHFVFFVSSMKHFCATHNRTNDLTK